MRRRWWWRRHDARHSDRHTHTGNDGNTVSAGAIDRVRERVHRVGDRGVGHDPERLCRLRDAARNHVEWFGCARLDVDSQRSRTVCVGTFAEGDRRDARSARVLDDHDDGEPQFL